VPWLLEAAVLIQLILGERVEAAVIAGLLVLNAVLSFIQEGRSQRALALLRQRLQVMARVRRDGQWTTRPADQLVPGDVVHLRQGVLVPADVRLLDGTLLVDQSALTGESAAVSVGAESSAYAGSMVLGGEATARITATGKNTFFGKTAELVRSARSANRQEHEIVLVVRNLFVLNLALVVVVLGYAHHAGASLGHVLPLLLAILLASIPVALPATFRLSAALGSLELSRRGILVTRLSALHDIASMTVLCSDKTGTLTRNEVAVTSLHPADGFSERDVVGAAAWASDPAGQDPVDGAIVSAAGQRGCRNAAAERVEFKPFDPALKRAEATYRLTDGTRRFVKGAPAVIAKLTGVAEDAWRGEAERIAARGQRVLAVATGDQDALRFAGLIGLADAVREDSRQVVSAIRDAGVRVVMVTGDNALTARAVAEQVGLEARLGPAEALRGEPTGDALDCSVFAGVFPEDKFKLVRAFQRRGLAVGMSGDGVNDAPALRQAEVGIAVANATDIAKAAAALVLTRPGLGDVLPAIETSRRVFQRIVTYTLNMFAKKIELMLLLLAGYLLTGHKPLTPLQTVLILFLNDFLTMALTTDRMQVSRRPNRWNTRGIVMGGAMALGKLAFSFGVFAFAHYALGFDTPHLQSLTFATVILSTHAGVYLLRERGHLWDSRPSRLLILSTAIGLATAALLSLGGILMTATSASLLFGVAPTALVYFFVLDWLKAALFARLTLR
jgi:H+-transporting ATPase